MTNKIQTIGAFNFKIGKLKKLKKEIKKKYKDFLEKRTKTFANAFFISAIIFMFSFSFFLGVRFGLNL